MPDFMHRLGRPFIASAMRRVADLLQSGASELYAEFGIAAPVRTASALLLLNEVGAQSVTKLATTLRQSHPTIISWVRELEQLKLVRSHACSDDGRRTLVSLTKKGTQQAELIKAAQSLFEAAYQRMCSEAGTDIFSGLVALEKVALRKSMAERLREEAAFASDEGRTHKKTSGGETK